MSEKTFDTFIYTGIFYFLFSVVSLKIFLIKLLFLHLNFRIIKLKFKSEPKPEAKVTAPVRKPWFCGNLKSEDICPERKLASPPPPVSGWLDGQFRSFYLVSEEIKVQQPAHNQTVFIF